jgi:hypothetical protein
VAVLSALTTSKPGAGWLRLIVVPSVGQTVRPERQVNGTWTTLASLRIVDTGSSIPTTVDARGLGHGSHRFRVSSVAITQLAETTTPAIPT